MSAPFVAIRDFLPGDARDAIFAFILARSNDFEPAQMDAGVDLDMRRTRFLANCLEGLEARWRSAFQARVASAFRAALPRIGVEAFVPVAAELHALIYREGDFFRRHQDDERDGARAVTFIYHLHRQPKTFSGGELVLYDEDGSATRILPEDNRLLLFPSHYFHEVVAVHGASEDPHARIAINGWFHRNVEARGADLLGRAAG